MMSAHHPPSTLAPLPNEQQQPRLTPTLHDALPHGTKRKAEDNLEHEQRLSKRFDLLNLEHTGKLWTPPPGIRPPPMRKNSNDAIIETMQLEDSKDKVYIHNLDEELAEIAREEEQHGNNERIIFIPDIDKKLNQIPDRVLRGEDEYQPTGQEMILYSVPSSLTVPQDRDSVRRAILDARERQRALQLEPANPKDVQESYTNNVNGISHPHPSITSLESTSRPLSPMEQDDDAMDIE